MILWFSVSKDILPNAQDLICGVVYIPPPGSKYAHSDPYLELQGEFDNFCLNSKHVLLIGDFNSRTARLPDFIECDDFIFDMHGNEYLYRERDEILQNFEINDVPLKRKSIDLHANAYGYQLTEFCKNNNIFILNGRLDHDAPRLTCKNSSTVDYVLSSSYNLDMLDNLTIHEFDSLYSDAHCPISL